MAVKRFPIEAGHVMTFARAIGDNNPVYFDGAATNEGEDRIIIPPRHLLKRARTSIQTTC